MFGRKPLPAWGVDLSDISAILSRLVPPAGALPAGSRPALPRQRQARWRLPLGHET